MVPNNKLAIVFLVYSWEDLDKIYNYSTISDDPEDFDLCIAKQQYVEIQACESAGISYFYLLHTETTKDIKIFNEEEQLYCYDYELFDKNHKKVTSLADYRTLLRANFYEIDKPLEYLDNLSAQNILTYQDEKKVQRWYKYVLPEFTKRKITGATNSQIFPSFLKDFADKQDKVFIKTEFKEVSFLTDFEISHFEPRAILESLLPTKNLIVSEPLNLCKDKKGDIEYRVWVVGKQISSISRYLYHDTDCAIPEEIEEFAKKFISAHYTMLPLAYSVDLGVDKLKGIVVIELNNFISCGRYAKNDFGKFLQHCSKIMNSQ